jgi:sugar lactone lactonase YvrE
MLACAAAFLGIGAPAASAAPKAEEPAWAFKTSFGTNAVPIELDTGRNIYATDSHGYLFTTSQFDGFVRVFAPDPIAGGTPLTEFSAGSGGNLNIAVDPSDDSVYVGETFFIGGTTIHRYISDGNTPPTYTLDPGFEAPLGEGVAVDPTTNDLLVADPGAEGVHRYETDGTLAETISTLSINPAFVAVASDGSFFVAPASGGDITHFNSAGTVMNTISAVGEVRAIAWDPTHSALIISVGNSLKTYSAAGQLLSDSQAQTSGGHGLAYDPVEEALYQGDIGTVYVYAPATIPGVEAPLVSDINATSAHVDAEVDPGAGPPDESRAYFEYSSDGGLSWTQTPEQDLNDPSPTAIGADLTGLTPNSSYLVRTIAKNSVTIKRSAATEFSTSQVAPETETGPVSDLTEASVILHGTVNPFGLQTGYHFEYGTTTSYGSRVPLVTDAPAGNLYEGRDVARIVTGLQPGVTYHYRLVAENAAGVSQGVDRTFTTLGTGEGFPERAYEQVTPVEKDGAFIRSDTHFQTADDGSAIAVSVQGAPKDAESALLRQNYLSRRGTSDWLDWIQVDPPQHPYPGINEGATAALSADFEHALVGSDLVLAPGGIAGGGNLYVKDLISGEYTFVAGAPGEEAWESLTGVNQNEEVFLAGAPDFSWIIFNGRLPFLPEASTTATYRWDADSGLQVESVFPGGSVPPIPVQTPSGVPVFRVASSDGSVVAYGLGAVFRRVDGGEPIPVSVSHIPGDSTEPQAAAFRAMTPDGRYVFFGSESRLTEDAPAGGGLYRYDATTDDMTFIAADLNYFLDISDDGQTAYFQTNSDTRVWRDGEVHVVTSATIVATTNQFYVTRNGRYLGWVDSAAGSDFTDQAQLYDAATQEVVCVSCPVAGEPAGPAHIRAATRTMGNRMPRAITDDGLMFFDTPTRLLASDHNGNKDVYAFKAGRLTLISPGNENYDASFIDASADGRDVFFQTVQGLVGQDRDGDPDVYDARVGGGLAAQSPASPPGSCQGPECAEAGDSFGGGPPVATNNTSSREATPVGRISLRNVRVGGGSVRLTVHATQAGRIRVSGTGVKPSSRAVAGAGTYKMAVPLTAKVRAKRRDHEPFEVALKIRLTGDWGTSTVKYSKTLGK